MENLSLSSDVSFLLLKHLKGPISSISISSIIDKFGLCGLELFGVLVLNFFAAMITRDVMIIPLRITAIMISVFIPDFISSFFSSTDSIDTLLILT